MRDFLQILIVGVNDGAAFAILGLALVVVYRSSRVLNFAQGELATVSTFIVSTAWLSGVPFWIAVAIGMVGGFVMGALMYMLINIGDSPKLAMSSATSSLGPNSGPLIAVIVTIGFFVGLNGLVQVIWGTLDRDWPTPFGRGGIVVGGLHIQWQKIGTMLMLCVVAGAFYLIFQRTRFGLAMRAVASNRESAALVGVPVSRLLILGWAMASTVGTLAGITLAVNLGLTTNLMQMSIIYALAAITLGGFDSFVGAVVGGITVGVLSSVLPRYVNHLEGVPILEQLVPFFEIPLAPAFVVIVVVLLVRPQGLFGKKGVSRV